MPAVGPLAEGAGPAPAGDRLSPAFSSILHDGSVEPPLADATDPRTLLDLNLGQVFDWLSEGREEYRLGDFLEQQLSRAKDIRFRHEVFRDLEGGETLERIRKFCRGMAETRRRLSATARLRYQRQQQIGLLEAARIYCETISSLAAEMARAELRSGGLLAFRAYLDRYVASEPFLSLGKEVAAVRRGLEKVEYLVHLRGRRITVRRFAAETDYSAEVQHTFERFEQHQVKDYLVAYSDWPEMNHVEAEILDLVARLFEPQFSALAQFAEQRRFFIDQLVERFDREAQFYLCWLERTAPLREAGLSFSYPEVSATEKGLRALDTFDLALAAKLTAAGEAIVCNDLELKGAERLLLVTGPNQGGKTTAARTFGQIHYLARLGYPVPGRETRVFLCDRLLTHFGREEKLVDLKGKLEEELLRVRDILHLATPSSCVVLNEIFTSATLEDARFLGRELMARLVELDLLCLWVTFVEELAKASPSTVSMTSQVAPDNPAERTFKVVRRPADGLAYALAIAERHGLTYQRLRQRLGS